MIGRHQDLPQREPHIELRWERYYALVGAAVPMFNGYLFEPDTALEAADRTCLTLSELDDIPCVVLVGEPGLGKSTAVEQDFSRTRARFPSNLVDLRRHRDESRLLDRLRSVLAPLVETSSDLVFLYIDSVDEFDLGPSVLAGILADAFPTAQISRLRIRFTCRSANWPSTLGAALRKYWHRDDCCFFELLPLTYGDVEKAARSSIANPDEFMRQVDRRQAGSFASKPITLFALLRAFERTGELPKSTAELYEAQCRILAAEQSPSRNDTGKRGQLTADQRILVASRIAACMTLCTRHSIWLGPAHEAPEGTLTPRDFAGGSESESDDLITVNESAVRETLESALFSSRGEGLVGLAHKSYEEFLAAWYLRQRRTPASQLSDLFTCADGAVIPNLLECAAWVAGWCDGFREQVLRHDPLVLLRSDIASFSASDKHRLVDELLGCLKNETITDHEWGVHRFYHRLSHPRLAEQLRPTIVDRASPMLPRRFAIDVAEACELTELQVEIAAVALDSNEDRYLRREAAHALIGIAGEPQRRALLPLLDIAITADPDDEIFGSALRALWPGILPTAELLRHLHSPRRSNFAGSYSRFLNSFPSLLSIEELPTVLSWAAEHWGGGDGDDRMAVVVDRLLEIAAPHALVPAIRAPVAALIWSRLARHRSVFHYDRRSDGAQQLFEDDEVRRLVILEIVSHISSVGEHSQYYAVSHRSGLMRPTDIEWIASIAASTVPGEHRVRLARLLRCAFNAFVRHRDWVEVFDVILLASDVAPEIREQFIEDIEPIALDSERAARLRAQFEETLRFGRELYRPPLVPSPSERLEAALDRADTGDPVAWVEAYGWLFVALDGVCQESLYFRAGVGESHGWKNADARLRTRMKTAARSYLYSHEPDAAAWVTSIGPRPDVAGYGGLVLLAMTGDLDARPLDSKSWQAWAPVICSYPGVSGSVDGVHEALRRAAYRSAPVAFLEAVCALALHQDRVEGRIHALDRLPKPEEWDDVARDRVSRLVRDDTLKAESLAVLLAALIRGGSADAVQLAVSRVPVPPPVDHARRSHAAAMASTLLFYASNETWDHVWKLFEIDVEFGKEVLLRIADGVGYRVNRKSFAQSLAEDRAALLFIWMERHFPRADDPNLDDRHPVSRRESAGELRDGLLLGLVARGTSAALQAIAMIQDKCPHLPFIKWQLLEARRTWRERSWMPLAPRDVLALLSSPDRRAVSSDGQLLDLLCQCLEALQVRLRRDGIYARTYWEQQSRSSKYIPVREARFRDLVAKFLTEVLIDRQVIVNREVEIIPHPAGHLGQRTDIVVQAALPASAEATQPLTVIVECKGCWNAGLRSSLKSQLVDRYLDRTTHTHGLYLVGWFASNAWDSVDPRSRQCAAIGETMEYLRSVAASHSRGGFDVRVQALENSLLLKP